MNADQEAKILKLSAELSQAEGAENIAAAADALLKYVEEYARSSRFVAGTPVRLTYSNKKVTGKVLRYLRMPELEVQLDEPFPTTFRKTVGPPNYINQVVVFPGELEVLS